MSTVTCTSTDIARTQRHRSSLNDKIIKSASPPEIGSKIIYDARSPGFGVRITSTGVKSFVLNYRFKGRERRITIGSYPAWTLLAARKQADHFRREVDTGIDPLEERNLEREAPTVRDLFERYVAEHLPTKAPRAAADDRSMWVKDILPLFGPKKVSDLTSPDCDRLHRCISQTRATRANRVNEVLRKALNLAIRWRWIDHNPASGVRRNPEAKRNRYLTRGEIELLVAALETHPERSSADAILFMLATGCRKGEALNAYWDQFDLKRQVWTKASSETKQRREHRVPYSSGAAAILERRRADAAGHHIFAGSFGAPLREVRGTWKKACAVAGIADVRLHDLRHTFASLVASTGQSMLVVGELLGHSSVQSTKRYAHLYDETLREAAERVAAAMFH